METPPLPGILPDRGSRAFYAPRSPSVVLAHFLSPGTPRSAVRGGRGAVARPRGGRVSFEGAGVSGGTLD